MSVWQLSTAPLGTALGRLVTGHRLLLLHATENAVAINILNVDCIERLHKYCCSALFYVARTHPRVTKFVCWCRWRGKVKRKDQDDSLARWDTLVGSARLDWKKQCNTSWTSYTGISYDKIGAEYTYDIIVGRFTLCNLGGLTVDQTCYRLRCSM